MDSLKLFVWKDVLRDYTAGVMFALAHDVEEARALLKKECDFIPEEELAIEPEVYEEPYAFHVWGGG